MASDGLIGALWWLCAASNRVLKQMYALQGSQRLYKRRKFLTSIYTPRMSKGDTGSVTGSQRHTKAVR